jgi:hypothetical protein
MALVAENLLARLMLGMNPDEGKQSHDEFVRLLNTGDVGEAHSYVIQLEKRIESEPK